MAEKTDVVAVRLDTYVKTVLQKIAKKESRTFAAQVRLALREWLNLKRRGEV